MWPGVRSCPLVQPYCALKPISRRHSWYCLQAKVICTQPGTKLDHLGIRAQLLGNIELINSGVKNHGFLSLSTPPASVVPSLMRLLSDVRKPGRLPAAARVCCMHVIRSEISACSIGHLVSVRRTHDSCRTASSQCRVQPGSLHQAEKCMGSNRSRSSLGMLIHPWTATGVLPHGCDTF